MINYPSKVLEQAVEEIAQLPGIGKRTALRLALHLLGNSKSKGEALSFAIKNLVNEIKYCIKCHTISNFEICDICNNTQRDRTTVCVVEDIRDLMAIENTNQYSGIYHVLGGKISPMDGIGPGNLKINTLVDRMNTENIAEIIFAMSSTMEGDTTIFYIYKLLKNHNLKFSTIARGISVGDELQYTDEVTLARSIQYRIPYSETANY